MKRTRLAVIGLGTLGRRWCEAIAVTPGFELAGVVRREPQSPGAWLHAPVVAHVSELPAIDAALVCVPVDAVEAVASALLQARIPIVECARLHGEAFVAQKAALHRVAAHHRVAAVVGAGCDPGALSLIRSQFALFVPHGHSETSLRTGSALHHSLAARVPGVRDALETERATANGATQRYLYVELDPGADAAAVTTALASDPLHLDGETLVFPVADLAELEDHNRGVLIERHAASGALDHTQLLFEARYDEARLAARMMLAASRALPGLPTGAHSLLDVPPAALWGEARLAAEKEWL